MPNTDLLPQQQVSLSVLVSILYLIVWHHSSHPDVLEVIMNVLSACLLLRPPNGILSETQELKPHSFCTKSLWCWFLSTDTVFGNGRTPDYLLLGNMVYTVSAPIFLTVSVVLSCSGVFTRCCWTCVAHSTYCLVPDIFLLRKMYKIWYAFRGMILV